MSLKTRGNQRLKNIINSNESVLRQELIDAELFNEITHSLVSLRKKSNLTQKELAEELGVKQSNISRWEQAGYQGYKVKMLSRIARTLGGQLFVSIQPITNFQYFHEAFEMQHEASITDFKPDGSWQRIDSKFKVKYEGVTLNANI
jgi:transcriptional regulator with XRE-family HTH domain